MLTARNLPAGSQAGKGGFEGLHALEPDTFILGVVFALDGKAEAAVAGFLCEVESQQHDMRAGDGMDGYAFKNSPFAHLSPLSVNCTIRSL